MKIKFKNERTGEIVREFNLHSNQKKFLKSKTRFPLFSGGMGCGKTMPLVLKVIKHLDYPNNLVILGRKRMIELKNSVMRDFFDLCPPNYIKRYNRTDNVVDMINGSTLIFVHFDRFSTESIKSMNIGAAAIDQVEQVTADVFDALDARLRRKIIPLEGQEPYTHQIMMTCNPAMFWAFQRYKQVRDDRYELFEGSTLDNKENLPPEQIDSLLKHPESWKRQFIYGVWDESLLADAAYFPIEYIQEQTVRVKKSLREFEGFTIYHEMDQFDEYQIGVDPSEGIVDYSAIVVVSKLTGEVCAVGHFKVPAAELAHKISFIGRIYRNALVILEVNASGMATLNQLRHNNYPNIWKREEFDRTTKKKTEKYGWKTNYANKVLLLDSFLSLMRQNRVRVNDERVISEMKTFIWTDVAKKDGLGAEEGFHDDLIIALALAYWGLKGDTQPTEITPAQPPRNSVFGTLLEMQKSGKYNDYIGN